MNLENTRIADVIAAARKATAESSDAVAKSAAARKVLDTLAAYDASPERFMPLDEEHPAPAEEPSPAPRPKVVAPPKPSESVQAEVSDYKTIISDLRKINEHEREVQIPSCGVFNPEIPNGVIRVRPLTARHEIAMVNTAAKSRGREDDAVANVIMQSCVATPGLDVTNLCGEDRYFLLIFIRGISFGSDYQISTVCPSCSAKNPHTINLDSDIQVTTLLQAAESGDHAVAERARQLIANGCISDVLPMSKLKFSYGVITGKSAQRRGVKGDSGSIAQYASFLKSIGGIAERKLKENLVTELPMADTAYIRDVMEQHTFGVDNNVTLYCPECGHEYTVPLPMNEHFFSTSRT